MIRLAALALGFAVAACQATSAPVASCQAQRDSFERAFNAAVERGAAQDFENQKTHMNEAQKLYMAMEEQGCCRETPSVCPALNVR